VSAQGHNAATDAEVEALRVTLPARK
jgi:hypothetical protein